MRTKFVYVGLIATNCFSANRSSTAFAVSETELVGETQIKSGASSDRGS